MEIILNPIGFVQNQRKEIIDDDWGTILSEIVLADHIITEALNGIEEFSHLAIIFYMNQVTDEKAIAQFRHPRNDERLPQLGTFAQRNKNRPNKLGLTTVELVERKSRSLIVKHLDAIDGTPVLDIKPVMVEFQPKGEIKQASWTNVIMKSYW